MMSPTAGAVSDVGSSVPSVVRSTRPGHSPAQIVDSTGDEGS